MLLIGSRATHVHFPSFRKPGDWDVIATPEEAAHFDATLPKKRASHRPNKLCFDHRGTLFEVEIAHPGSTAEELLRTESTARTAIVTDVGPATIATPEALLLVKLAHVPFAIHWQKTVKDIRFLRKQVGDLPARLGPLLERRMTETAGFLSPSQKKIPREHSTTCGTREASAVHARVHAVVALGSAPAKALRTPFEDLSRDERVALLAEETMTLAVERLLVWGTRSLAPGREARLVEEAYEQMVTSSLPETQRPFAVTAMDRVLARVPHGFALRACAAVADASSVVVKRASDVLRPDDEDLLVRYGLG